MLTLLAATPSAPQPCPSPSELDSIAATGTRDELVAAARACASVADEQRRLMEAVQTILQATGSAQMAPPPQTPPPPVPPRRHSAATLPPLHEPAPPVPPRRSRPAATAAAATAAAGSQRKSLSTWHESRAEQALAQRAQAERVARNQRPGKREVVVAAAGDAHDERRWEVPCDYSLYGLGLPGVAQCTPAPRGGALPPKGCARVLRDGFLDVGEQEALIATFERAMRNLFHQGGQTSFAPDAASAARQMGAPGHALFRDVLRRVQATIAADFGLPALYSAGSLLTRIWADDQIPDDGMNIEPGHKYWNAHVDKANRASYDYSALLYLNAHCAGGGDCDYESTARPDFDGGRFAWLDDDEDVVVEPRGGRLLTFTGGLENLHGVRKVTAGTRYVIGMWFTCHEELEYHDDEEDERASGGGDALLPPPSQPAPPVPPRRRGGGAGRAAAVPAEFAGALDAFAAAAGGVAQQAAPPVPPRRKKKAKGGASGGGGGGALADDATMEEAMAVYREALAAYDAIHGPPDALPPFVDDAAAEVDAERAWADFAASVGEAGPSGEGFDPWGGHLAAKKREGGAGGLSQLWGGGADYDGAAPSAADDDEQVWRRLAAAAAAAAEGGGVGERVDCGYPGITEPECVERSCRWDDSQMGVPWCFA